MIDLEEIKSRINPQYADMTGTESHERKMLCDEIESLRQQLAELSEINNNHAFNAKHFKCEYEKVSQQLAVKDADIAFLNRQRDAIQTLATHWSNKHDEVLQQLAASQLQNTQLRETVEATLRGILFSHRDECKREGIDSANKALALPADTSALSAIVTKAGEATTHRVIRTIEEHQIPVGNSAAGEMACEWTYAALREIREEIRALPGVTLEDLQK